MPLLLGIQGDLLLVVLQLVPGEILLRLLLTTCKQLANLLRRKQTATFLESTCYVIELKYKLNLALKTNVSCNIPRLRGTIPKDVQQYIRINLIIAHERDICFEYSGKSLRTDIYVYEGLVTKFNTFVQTVTKCNVYQELFNNFKEFVDSFEGGRRHLSLEGGLCSRKLWSCAFLPDRPPELDDDDWQLFKRSLEIESNAMGTLIQSLLPTGLVFVRLVLPAFCSLTFPGGASVLEPQNDVFKDVKWLCVRANTVGPASLEFNPHCMMKLPNLKILILENLLAPREDAAQMPITYSLEHIKVLGCGNRLYLNKWFNWWMTAAAAMHDDDCKLHFDAPVPAQWWGDMNATAEGNGFKLSLPVYPPEWYN